MTDVVFLYFYFHWFCNCPFLNITNKNVIYFLFLKNLMVQLEPIIDVESLPDFNFSQMIFNKKVSYRYLTQT